MQRGEDDGLDYMRRALKASGINGRDSFFFSPTPEKVETSSQLHSDVISAFSVERRLKGFLRTLPFDAVVAAYPWPCPLREPFLLLEACPVGLFSSRPTLSFWRLPMESCLAGLGAV